MSNLSTPLHLNHLNGLRVLVTRPLPDGLKLAEAIRLAGGNAIYFPVMRIEPLQASDALTAANTICNTGYSGDWLIFISPQAVYQSKLLIQHHSVSLPVDIKIAAMGGGTAKAIEQSMGYHVDYFPIENWGSDGLLAAPAFQTIEKNKIAIIKGEGGREILRDTLQARGAIVTEINVYRRCMTSLPVQPYLDLLANHKLDSVICTSNQLLYYIKKLLYKKWHELKSIPLIVISNRIREEAEREGFQDILLAKNASFDAIIAMLKFVNTR